MGKEKANTNLLEDIYDINLVLKLVLPFKSLDIWSQTNIKIVGKIGLEFPDLEFM